LSATTGCSDDESSAPSGDASTDTDTDTDTETDTETETDGGVASDMTDCDGGKLDPLTNLCWQNPPSTDEFTWNEAVTYCDGLSLAGHDDWRLPMIQELISLLRGCVGGTETSDLSTSTCGVTDPDCLVYDACWDSACSDCEWLLGGPDDDPVGCYWDPTLAGECNSYWSSSSLAYSAYDMWIVVFDFGYVVNNDKSHATYARCVRGGP
jgi:hypothetical protein